MILIRKQGQLCVLFLTYYPYSLCKDLKYVIQASVNPHQVVGDRMLEYNDLILWTAPLRVLLVCEEIGEWPHPFVAAPSTNFRASFAEGSGPTTQKLNTRQNEVCFANSLTIPVSQVLLSAAEQFNSALSC